MKNYQDLLVTFAVRHVQSGIRERFLHEALKKPGKLQSRICHTIHDIFSPHPDSQEADVAYHT